MNFLLMQIWTKAKLNHLLFLDAFFVRKSIGLIGYATGLAGFILAFMFLFCGDKCGNRFKGIVAGFSGGALIAFVCFGLLPQAFAGEGLFFGIAGIIAGVCVYMLIEARTHSPLPFTALRGIALGIALGSVLGQNFILGLMMCPVVALHCVPEAISVIVLTRKSKKGFKLLASCLLLALPIGISSFVGAVNISRIFASLCASFAGGVIIYMACGEIIPDARKARSATLTVPCAALGFAAGVLLTLIAFCG